MTELQISTNLYKSRPGSQLQTAAKGRDEIYEGIWQKLRYWQIVDAFKQQPNSFAHVFYSDFYQCKGITLFPLKIEISKEDKVREKSIAESIIRLLPKTREKLTAAVV